MATIKMRLTCLAIASGFLVCITYLISNKKYQNALLNVQFHTNYENNNNNRFQDDMTARKIRQRSSTKQSFVAAFPQRARLVNDVGEIFADEQPDFNEIRALNIENSIITLKNKRHLDPTDKSASSAMSQQHVAQQNTSSVYRRPFGVVESDPHIDDNVVPISYKFYVNNNNIRDPTCTNDSPVNYVVSLFIHQTGIQTVNNIFYRYGDFNNHYFALPKPSNFKYYWPLRFHPSYVDKSLLDKTPPNFLLNGARYSKESLESLVPNNAVYLAMLRNPVDHFQSIYDFAGVSYFMKMIHKSGDNATQDMLQKFTHNPLENIHEIVNATKEFEPRFHLLKNAQLFDLGFELSDYKEPRDMQFILNKLDEQLDFVLIYEYLDESLVLLQRLLCWEIEDMVHLKSHVLPGYRYNISEQTKKEILEWNHEDALLYAHFNKTFWKRVHQQEDQTFWEDVAKLREMSKAIDEECVQHNDASTTKNPVHPLNHMSKSVKNTRKHHHASNITAHSILSKSHASNLPGDDSSVDYPIKDENMEFLCERLLLSDKEYVMLLKLKQKQRIKDHYEAILKDNFVTNGTNGRFLYALKFVEQKQHNFNQSDVDSSQSNHLSFHNENTNSQSQDDNDVEPPESEISILKL